MKMHLSCAGSYGRDLSAYVATHAATQHHHYACAMCGAKDVPLLITDGSDGEYAEVPLCRTCVNQLFDNPETPC